jgi:hypothetical protein
MKTKFREFINENDGGAAMATLGNTAGMGNIVAPQPSSVPGDVAGGSIGSGDITSGVSNYYLKQSLQPYKKSHKKRKNKKN